MLRMLLQAGAVGDIQPLVGYGLLGWALAALVYFAKRVLDRETARADRLEQENQRLYTDLTDRAIEALMRGTAAVETSSSLQRELVILVERLKATGA